MSQSNSSGGIGFIGLLTVLFIGLKLTGHITWSWIWVLSPLWIGPLTVLSLIAFVFMTVVIGGLFADFIERHK
jgi:hypothetical protein